MQQNPQAAARQVLVVQPGREADPPPPVRELRGRKLQIKELRKGVGCLCGQKHPRAPRMASLFDIERATKAVLSFGKRGLGRWSLPHLGMKRKRGSDVGVWRFGAVFVFFSPFSFSLGEIGRRRLGRPILMTVPCFRGEMCVWGQDYS